MFVSKLLLAPIKIRIFGPKNAFLGTYRPCRFIWCPVGWWMMWFKANANDDAGDEYANCKPSSGGESFCAKNFDKCIPDQPAARNRYGHAFQDDDLA